MKSRGVLFLCVAFLCPALLYAESWVDGIKFRDSKYNTRIRFFKKESSQEYREYNNRNSEISGDLPFTKDFPIILTFKESLMSASSFRGGYMEYRVEEVKNLSGIPKRSDNYSFGGRADLKYEVILYGYKWGVFIPVGVSHRFLKVSIGGGISLIRYNFNCFKCPSEGSEDSSSAIMGSSYIGVVNYEYEGENSKFEILGIGVTGTTYSFVGDSSLYLLLGSIDLFSYTYRF